MRSLILFLCLLSTLSCGKVENSSSQDKYIYSPAPTGSSQFSAASAAIAAKCSECHASWSGFSESDFVQSGLVVAQNLEASKIYYRNQNAASGPGPKNMPTQGRPTFTATELGLIEDWIRAITP